MRKTVLQVPALVLVGLWYSASALPNAGWDAQDRDGRFSQAEAALLGSYHLALGRAEVREATHANLLRQIRIVPPVAFIDGYWVTPLDLAQVFQIPAVLNGVGAAAQSAAADGALRLLNDPHRLRQLAAFAFTAHSLGERLAVPQVGDFERIARSEAQVSGVFVAPVKDVEWAVVERIPPYPRTTPDDELDCYFFCGDPATWDFDRDGVPNAHDDDDDDDGVPDGRDAYPYWPDAGSCACGGASFVGFTETFSVGITKAVLAAFDLVKDLDEGSRAVTLEVGAGASNVQVVFPPPLSQESTLAAGECPDSSDPGVRYVSVDPRACARLRFRCEGGTTPFSGHCGCGCKGR